ncbi:methyl-accepting chemotaxis protein [Alteromonas lipolytica]|uniref:Chemotaxis protein n=1 Tax=Alteromonas lipolytica TaxID=1856405 RepID=A0A1E8FD15_9ALTE|nr:methyl-accepting chemotaxis protein [Alteromonas lipolytica]OFI33822.1 hypothetical protein BFC17_19835 [Alteromonas lipolytica]GGF68068.1 methyl-accepting chemotaxis protein [Alteromonas lipolytica]
MYSRGLFRTISGRLYASIAGVILALLVLEAVNIYTTYTDAVNARKREVQSLVQSAVSQLNAYHLLVAKGELTAEQAKSMALEQLNQQRYQQGEYFFVLDSDVVMLGHGDRADVRGKNYSKVVTDTGEPVFAQMAGLIGNGAKQADFFGYKWKKEGAAKPEPKISYVAVFKPWGWALGTGVFIDDITAQLQRNLIISSAVVVIIGAVMLLVGLRICGSIVNPLRQVNQTMQRVADADLSVRLNSHAQDELGEMSRNIDRTLNVFQSLMTQLVASATQVQSSAEQLATAAEQTNEGVQAEMRSTQQLYHAVESLGATIDSINEQANQTAQLSELVETGVKASYAEVAESEISIKTMSEVVANTAIQLRSLEADTVEIANVLVEIESISEQTNLLALNAAIEAARAGDSGRGFAVVADEVRQLAMRTRSSTEEVRGVIERLRGSVAQSVSSMEQSEQNAIDSMELTSHANDNLEQILGHVENVRERALDGAQATEEQSMVVKDIQEHLGDITVISEQSGGASQMVAANSEQLSQLASDLQRQVSQFKL